MPDYTESCRACTSFKSFMKAHQASVNDSESKKSDSDSGGKSKSHKDNSNSINSMDHVDCPVDKDDLGRASWTFLHTMAAYYPDKPTDYQRSEMKQFIDLFSKFYPCSHCAKDMRDDIKVDSRKSFSLWMCNLHNKVNKKLSKPLFDCSNVDERWLTGPPNGKCD
ncbi:LOW QUALITY PROTEIN: FAD-linked sulfhydryl oxidase ALR-like [Panonychus citri]|uniref:LOW QUALITY PROTEIN: FAD-linked sulfhydryl oxidase ALR-like n=1 Tax=Panonychus citri TaxID=50023 RepID=UPI002307D54C|nr:LOW QUALITY PROTEIN: FAD-linked sulfhydryl oxidase ALR-like [Panonychus citri]